MLFFLNVSSQIRDDWHFSDFRKLHSEPQKILYNFTTNYYYFDLLGKQNQASISEKSVLIGKNVICCLTMTMLQIADQFSVNSS